MQNLTIDLLTMALVSALMMWICREGARQHTDMFEVLYDTSRRSGQNENISVLSNGRAVHFTNVFSIDHFPDGLLA